MGLAACHYPLASASKQVVTIMPGESAEPLRSFISKHSYRSTAQIPTSHEGLLCYDSDSSRYWHTRAWRLSACIVNDELNIILYFLCTSLTAGLLGTCAMTLFMTGVTRSGLTNADMVRAVGSILTRSLDNALLVGSITHTTLGVVWAMIYIIAFNFLGVEGPWLLTLAGFGFGFGHGFVLSFFLVATVAEHHPMPEFRDAGVSVAVTHLLGHMVYGLVVGLIVGLSGFSAV